MKHLYNLFSRLNIRPGEERLVGLMLVYAFFIGLPTIPLETVSYTLFLVEFNAESIPYIYIGFAVVTTITGLIYTSLEKRIPFATLMTGNLAFLVLSLAGFRLWLELSTSKWPIMALAIWYDSSWTLANLGFWSFATHLLNVQQGKRLFALIGVGLTLSQTLVGFIIPTLVSLMGIENLLWLASGSFVLALGVQSYILRHYKDHLIPKVPSSYDELDDEETITLGTFRQLLANPYIVLVFLFSLIYILAYYLLDGAFYDIMDRQFTDPDQLASFLGLFFAISGVLTMIVGLFVSGQVIHKQGVRFGLLIMPITLLVGTGAIAFVGSLTDNVVALFGAVIITKAVAEILGSTLHLAASHVLYEPIEKGLRFPTQTAVETIIKPIGGGFAGIILLGLNYFFVFEAVQIAYLLVIALIVWIGVIFRLDKLYLASLLDALTRRRFDKTTIPLDGGQSNLTALKKGLTSPHPGVVVYSLNLLEEFEPDSLALFLQELLAHPHTEIRLEALTRIERWQLTETAPTIRAILRDETEDIVWGASLRTLAILGGPEVFSEISAYMESPNPKIKLGAIVGLLNNQHLDKTYITTIRQKLMVLSQSEQPSDRVFVAQVIGEAGIYTFNRLLLKLLRDDRSAVCGAALDAVKQLNHPDLWPVVIEHLANPKLRAKAVSALVAGDRYEVLPAIKVAFNKANQPPTTLIQLTQVCSRIGSDESITLLLDQLIVPDERVKHQILLALNQCGYQATGDDVLMMEQKIKTEVAWATWTLASLVDLGEEQRAFLLKNALYNNLARHRERILLWLSFIYHPGSIKKVQNALELFNVSQSGLSSDQTAYALEVVEVLVSSTSTNLKPILVPLLDNQLTPYQCLNALSPYFPYQQLSYEERLETMIAGGGAWLNPWTKSCAIYTAFLLGLTDMAEVIVIALSSRHLLIQESALWALFNLDKSLYQQAVIQLPKNTSPQIHQVIQALQVGTVTVSRLSLIEKVIFLKAVHIFSETPEDILVEVAFLLTEVHIAANEQIFAKSDPGNSLYIIVNGRVKIHDGTQIFDKLDSGDVFGELSLLDSQPRSAAATSIKAVRLLRLKQGAFYELLAERSEVAQGIIRVLIQRLRSLNKQLVGE
ncbi:Npt1/Npt2 family nucleotide transporter [Anaerolineales bacterium HSG25]|nr:Npt1/Npt2 family nucleotide transporter [Anaerolineales bacterium HSG25]